MDKGKREKLLAAGWRSGDAATFLELTPEESAFVELKLALREELRERRLGQEMSQEELADVLGSSQSR